MFYECEDSDIENYGDNTTPSTCASDINTLIAELQITVSKLFRWSNNNHMKANTEKKPPSFEFQNSEKGLFLWSHGRIKFN